MTNESMADVVSTLYEFYFVLFVRLFYNNTYLILLIQWFKISTDVIKTIWRSVTEYFITFWMQHFSVRKWNAKVCSFYFDDYISILISRSFSPLSLFNCKADNFSPSLWSCIKIFFHRLWFVSFRLFKFKTASFKDRHYWNRRPHRKVTKLKVTKILG